MSRESLLAVDAEIRRLRPVAESLSQAARGFPAAERNTYMILRHLEMLEMEICDVVDALGWEAISTTKE